MPLAVAGIVVAGLSTSLGILGIGWASHVHRTHHNESAKAYVAGTVAYLLPATALVLGIITTLVITIATSIGLLAAAKAPG